MFTNIKSACGAKQAYAWLVARRCLLSGVVAVVSGTLFELLENCSAGYHTRRSGVDDVS